ncbi:MAG: hypothetical protein MZV70_15435 [Desulfobacterales bacterium]|nr:hypothetical protein [Desulfobacterales bacterium]
MDWSFADKELPEKALMEELARIARSRVNPSIVCWSGSTKTWSRERKLKKLSGHKRKIKNIIPARLLKITERK